MLLWWLCPVHVTHDAAYADDFASINDGTFYEQILDKFYNEIQPYAANVPYMLSPGNHVCVVLHFSPRLTDRHAGVDL